MLKFTNLYSRQQTPSIELDINIITQGALLTMYAISILLMWIAIIEVKKKCEIEEAKYPKRSIYSISTTLALFTVLSMLGLPSKISPFFTEISIYLSLALTLALIIVIISDKTRNAFTDALPIPSILRSKDNNTTYRPVEKTASPISPPTYSTVNTNATGSRSQTVSTNRKIETISIPMKIIEETNPQLKENNVRREPHIDPDYLHYQRWLENRLLPPSKISYEEFHKIRNIVDATMGEKVFGMTQGKLDILSLSLLARIDSREDIEEIKKFHNGKCFENLRKFKLVSEHGRLMAKGVKLIKALKKEGLIKKLREQTK